MKTEVLQFLAESPKSKPQQFNKALELFRKSPNHSNAILRFCNNMGFSQDRLNTLFYELKKLHGISQVDVVNARLAPKAPLAPEGGVKQDDKKAAEKTESKKDPEMVVVDAKDIDKPEDAFNKELEAFDVENEKYHSIRSFAAKLSDFNGLEPANQKAETLKGFILEAKKKFLES